MNSNGQEKQTIRQMIEIYCRGKHHGGGDLCGACRELLAYAEAKLDRCPHKQKPACKDCEIHCYAPEKRLAIQAVMRYAGPRMLLRRPLAAITHILRKGR